MSSLPGTGGLPARRLDQQYSTPAAGVQAGSSAGIFRGRLVVVSGTSTNGSNGIFVYSGTPGAGNLIVSIAAVAGTDQYGNAYPAGLNVTVGSISGSSIILSGGTITGPDYIINRAGFFFYSGTPAAGNMVSSSTSGPGLDASGNQYLGGETTYSHTGSIYYALSQSSGGIAFYTASSQAGPWVQSPLEITAAGIFSYSAAPAPGNLTFAVTNAAGTDSWGNIYAAGVNFYAYTGTAPVVTTKTSGSGIIPIPAGVATAVTECWGDGSGGCSGSGGSAPDNGASGGGGAYSKEPALAVTTAGVAYSVGAGGAAGGSQSASGPGQGTTASGTAVTVTAYGGTYAQNSSAEGGGGGGPASGNTVSFPGGNGGDDWGSLVGYGDETGNPPTGLSGNPGGSGASPAGAGNPSYYASVTSGTGVVAGYAAPTGGGPGGNGGGTGATSGTAGTAPGGGGGGGQDGSGNTGGAGAAGQVKVTYIPAGSGLTAIPIAVSAEGNLIFTGADGNIYETGRLTQSVTGTPVTITTSSAAIGGLSAKLGQGKYHIHAIMYVSNTAAAVGTAGFTPVFGGTTSAVFYRLRSHQLGTSTVVLTSSTATTLAQLITQSMAASATFEVDIELWVTVTALGTLTMNVIEEAGTGVLTIISPSFWDVLPCS